MNNALPPYVFLPTGLFLAKLIAHREGEDRSRWVTDFAVHLVDGEGHDDFARSLIDTAVMKHKEAMNRVRRSRAKSELISEGVKNPTRQQIEERLKEIYADEESTQDAPNGNAGVDLRYAGNGDALKLPTSCDQFTADDQAGNPKTRESETRGPQTDNNLAESATRTSEAVKALADGDIREARESQARQSQRRAVANAQKCGRTSQSNSATARSAGPAKAAYGEFSNVMLTDDEFRKLCERCPDADAIITELDQYIESQGKEKKYKNHYATLLNWSRRKTQEAKPKQLYMTSDDISKKNYEESKSRLDAMFSNGSKNA